MVDSGGDVNPRVPVEIPASGVLSRPYLKNSPSATPSRHARRSAEPSGARGHAKRVGQLVRRRRAAKATPARPVTISAHVPGSGTVAGGATAIPLTKYV